MIKIDLSTSPRKKQYEWFKSFANPCYGIDTRIDVTNIVNHAKQQNQSFFINFLYLITEALHSVEELRLRISGDDVVLYDLINPSYTIMKDTGIFGICRHKMTHDYNEFYSRAAIEIEKTKHNTDTSGDFNDLSILDDFYISSLPWVDYTSISHPIPDISKENASIPRISWGKFVQDDNKYKMTLNITVNHALVDGKPLCDVFLNLEKLIENISKEKVTIKGWSEL